MMGALSITAMAVRDYVHEWLMSLCTIFGLVAVLAPLLIIFGIKAGLIGTMRDRLIENPRTREVALVGIGRFDDAWFARLAARADVAFITPQTRSLAATLDLASDEQTLTLVDIVPTGPRDPVLERWGRLPTADTEIVVSSSVARKLRINAGQTIVGRVGRVREGLREQENLSLRVAAVLPPEAFGRDAAFVTLPLLVATERYRDGLAEPHFQWSGTEVAEAAEAARQYPSFRLYARSIEDVASLEAALHAQGLEVHTHAEEIEAVHSLDHGFAIVFWTITAVSAAGYFLATASNGLANVVRKKRELGILGLVGYSRATLVLFPMAQGVLTAALGTGLAATFYTFVEPAINGAFAQHLLPGEAVCRLRPTDFAHALALSLAVVVTASTVAALQIGRIDPAEVIRDV